MRDKKVCGLCVKLGRMSVWKLVLASTDCDSAMGTNFGSPTGKGWGGVHFVKS